MATAAKTQPVPPPLMERRANVWIELLRNIRREPMLMLASAILLTGLFFALFSTVVARTKYERVDPVNRLQAPEREFHYFGTDVWGRDVFDRTIVGTRLSFLVGFSVTAISTVAGVLIALVVGYFRMLDNILMRFVDGLLAFPPILLALALIAILGPSIANVIIALSVTGTASKIRLVRSMVLTLRDAAYVESATAVGARIPRVLLLHILPNTVGIIIVQATFTLASAILAEAGLSFLGAGVPPSTPSWGNIVAEGQGYIQVGWWISFFPGLFLTFTVLAVVLIGDALRDHLDPRLRGRLETRSQ